MDALEKKNSALEVKLVEAQKSSSHTVEKLQEVEQKCTKLQQNVKRCESWIALLNVIFSYHLSCMPSPLLVFWLLKQFYGRFFSDLFYVAPYTPILCSVLFFVLPHLSSFSTLLKYSLEEKLSVLEDENHVLRQRALNATPRSNRPNFVRALSEVRYFVNNMWTIPCTNFMYLWTMWLFIW